MSTKTDTERRAAAIAALHAQDIHDFGERLIDFADTMLIGAADAIDYDSDVEASDTAHEIVDGTSALIYTAETLEVARESLTLLLTEPEIEPSSPTIHGLAQVVLYDLGRNIALAEIERLQTQS